jgi:hypothetical protein
VALAKEKLSLSQLVSGDSAVAALASLRLDDPGILYSGIGATLFCVRLSTDGDSVERRYWDGFVADRFPGYEEFWLTRVVPLTRRNLDRADIDFLPREELAAKADEDVAVAQLHYTTLIHIGRVHDLLEEPLSGLADAPRALPGPGSAIAASPGLFATGLIEPSGGSATWHEARGQIVGRARDFDFDAFTEAFVRLAAASDVADEMLERCATPGEYDPWDERQGKRARLAWRKKHGDPLKPIRAYRNRLVHGRVVPRLVEREMFKYPRLDKVDGYLDWRRVNDPDSQSAVAHDFDRGREIVFDAWDQTVTYVETYWRAHLLA